MKQNSIKTIKPISEEEIKNAPWVSVKTAIRLTGLGEKVIRTLPIERFGKSDFASVKAVNHLILKKLV